MSERIKGIYKRKGLKPPNGKGIHTVKFHEVAAAIMKKGGAKKPYAVAMKIVTPVKAVKKSHWKTIGKKRVLKKRKPL